MRKNLFICQLGEYFEKFLPEIHGSSKNTIASYADSFAIFFQFMHEKKGIPHHLLTYKHFTSAMFDQYMLWMTNARNYSSASIRHRMSAVVSFLKYASRREMSALNAYSVATGTKLPSVVYTEFPYFTLEEMGIMLRLPAPNAYLGSRDLVLLSFLYETAARAEELCNVSVGDIRFSSPTKVKLHGKGSKTREVPVSEDVAKLLRYHMKNNALCKSGDKGRPLFSSQTNERMTTACVRSIVVKYVGIAKRGNPTLFQEENYSPHSYRHSKAVHMVEAGIDLIYIRNFLGHAHISSTEIYARVGQAAVTKALTNRKIPRLAADEPKPSEIQYQLPGFIIAARK